MKMVLKALPLALVAGAFGAMGASASTIDLTDTGTYTTATPGSATGTTDGVAWTITPLPAGATLTYNPGYDGASTPPAPLAFETDGLGVNSSTITGGCDAKNDLDEISGSCESVTLTFDQSVLVSSVDVLDLFGGEQVFIYDDNNQLVGTINSVSAAGDNTYGGFADGTNASGALFSTGVWTSSLTFVAGPNNDSPTAFGTPDFALAAITVAAVPVPAAGLLLLGALGGLGLAKRRRKAA